MCNLPHRAHGMREPGSKTKLFNYQTLTFSDTNTDLDTLYTKSVSEASVEICISTGFVSLPLTPGQLDFFAVMYVFFICSYLFSM